MGCDAVRDGRARRLEVGFGMPPALGEGCGLGERGHRKWREKSVHTPQRADTIDYGGIEMREAGMGEGMSSSRDSEGCRAEKRVAGGE